MESAIDTSKITPEMCAALSSAQASAETVGKDGNNTHGGYKYATAEAMIRGARQAMAQHGLSVVTTWTADPVDPPEVDTGQWVCAHISYSWVLLHASGGQISGSANIDAIGSKRRPPDKAVAAALTYAHGFVLRGLLNLDRAEEDTDAPDQRKDDEGWGRGQPRQQTQRRQHGRRDKAPPIETPPRDAAVEDGRAEVLRLAKLVLAKADALGWKRDLATLASNALGKPWDQQHDRTVRYSAQEYEAIRRDLVVELEMIEAEEKLRAVAEQEMDSVDGAAE